MQESRGGSRERPGGQQFRVEGDDGPDADLPELAGGAADLPDPSAHGAAVRETGLAGSALVPAPGHEGKQGLPDQPGRVRAAREQPGAEDHVGGAAAGAPAPVRAGRHQGAAEVADGALTGLAPGLQGLAAVRAPRHPAGQRTPRRCRTEDLDHRSYRQAAPRRLAGEGASGVAPWQQNQARATRAAGGPGKRHQADAHAP